MSIFSKSAPSSTSEIGVVARDASPPDAISDTAASRGWMKSARALVCDSFPNPVAVEGEERGGERDAEMIIAVFRTLVLMVVLVGPRLLGRGSTLQNGEIWLAAVAGVYNIVTGLGCLLPSRYGLRRPFIVAMDLLLVSMWIQLSQQWELQSFYYIVVVVAAMWFRVFGGILAAAFCNFFFLFIWFRAAAEAATIQRSPVITTLAINTALLFAVGCLVGYLAEAQERERVRRGDDQLLIANYQSEIDLSTQLQPSLIAPQWIGDGNENGGVLARREAALEIGAAMKSARTLGGGDYFDVIALPEGRTGLCIADVSGKSVRAQARLPVLKYSLRALAPLYESPHALIERLNQTLSPDLQPEFYIALCYIVLDPQRQTLSCCNAGHIAPLLIETTSQAACGTLDGLQSTVEHVQRTSGRVEEIILPLDADGPPLGMFPELSYETRVFPWRVGSQLLLFTDGLSDAFSYRGSEDGEVQVRKLAARLRDQPDDDLRETAAQWVEMAAAALDAAPSFDRLRPLSSSEEIENLHRDDITVIIARHAAPEGAATA